MRGKLALVVIAVVAGGLPAVLSSGSASAATFYSGCSPASLRSSLNIAMGSQGPHTVVLPAGCVYRFSTVDSAANPDNALPVVTRDVTIEGNGAVFERQAGAPNMRFLEVRGGDTLTLRDLTLRHGANPPSDGYVNSAQYAGESNGGAVRCTDADLVLEDVLFEDNEAQNGGAVFVESCTVDVTRTIFSYNRANDGDGGGLAETTDFEGESDLRVIDSEFLDNEAGVDGGGLFVNAAYISIEYSAFRRNVAGDDGGGLLLSEPGPTGQNWIEWTTISRNSAGDLGGGLATGTEQNLYVRYSSIWNNDARSGGGVAWAGHGEIVLSTISNNTASASGGGISHYDYGELYLERDTIANNTAPAADAIRAWGELDMINTLVAYTDGLPAGDLCDTVPNGWLVVYDESSLSEGDCFSAEVIGEGAADLQPLNTNGGPTRTHAIGSDSAAKDAGDQSFCDSMGWSRDQRGEPYWGTDGPACDVGSYENQLVMIASTVPISRLVEP